MARPGGPPYVGYGSIPQGAGQSHRERASPVKNGQPAVCTCIVLLLPQCRHHHPHPIAEIYEFSRSQLCHLCFYFMRAGAAMPAAPGYTDESPQHGPPGHCHPHTGRDGTPGPGGHSAASGERGVAARYGRAHGEGGGHQRPYSQQMPPLPPPPTTTAARASHRPKLQVTRRRARRSTRRWPHKL